MPARAQPALLDAAYAEFMQQGVSIVAASRDAGHLPMLSRATGCKISGDLRRVTLFMWTPQAAPLLECVRGTGMLAVVFCEVTTHHTIQVKATDARLTKITRHDHTRIERYRTAFAQALGSIEYDESLGYGLLSGAPDECVGITFTPGALFGQTPGPGAGEPLVLKR